MSGICQSLAGPNCLTGWTMTPQLMERARRYALYSTAGAVAYWMPDVLVHCLLPLDRVCILLLTVLPPAAVIVSAILLSRHPSPSRSRVAVPMFMLLGIWALGPIAIAIGAIPTGGTFLERANLAGFLAIWAIFPISTWMMATYSGSLGGLGLATLSLLLAARIQGVRPVGSQDTYAQRFSA
jgi:hypothetical protein